MPVVPLTIVFSLCLVFTFVMFFLRLQAQGKASSPERDALLPFAEERSAVAPSTPKGRSPSFDKLRTSSIWGTSDREPAERLAGD